MKEVSSMTFADAVRIAHIARSGDANLLESILNVLQISRERRNQQREEEMQERESARKAALIQLL